MTTIYIAYGSETGNSEGLAYRTRDQLIQSGYSTEVVELDDIDPSSLPQIKVLFVMCAGYNDEVLTTIRNSNLACSARIYSIRDNQLKEEKN